MIKLLDLLNETRLFELAYERKNAINRLDNLSCQISIHMLKLIVFNDSADFYHWLTELNGWLNQVDDISLKPNNKKLRKQDYLKYLKEHYLEDEQQISLNIKNLKKRYKNEQMIYYDSKWVLEKIEYLMDRICSELASDDFTPLTEQDFDF
jgi:hypothetical protein